MIAARTIAANAFFAKAGTSRAPGRGGGALPGTVPACGVTAGPA
ncbi:hypothetical protein DESPIGER_1942 [Desulfovibrio piger]|uniref:Uncharacterized protein n=1 Tax=Desulfovibrio piger TaxID=901 RepID=A0A1K1LGC1_9BACT|nr:hypothetical protein DESPIGER_1942 [Desulfovibrio piger]